MIFLNDDADASLIVCLDDETDPSLAIESIVIVGDAFGVLLKFNIPPTVAGLFRTLEPATEFEDDVGANCLNAATVVVVVVIVVVVVVDEQSALLFPFGITLLLFGFVEELVACEMVDEFDDDPLDGKNVLNRGLISI